MMRAFLAILTCLTMTCPAMAETITPVPEGQVRFYNIADSDFDRYSKRPSATEQQWMRDHYTRMQTYSSFFNQRLAWYPNAWVYKDSYAIKSHWPVFKEHSEWILRGSNGRKLYIPWGCSNGECPQYAADIGNPKFRTHWINEARVLIEKGYRGLWVDDVNLTWRVSDGDGNHVRPIDPRTKRPMRLDDWQGYFATFMEEIRSAFPDVEIAHNSIWYADSLDNPAIVRQIKAADYINLERGATDPGLKAGAGKWGLETFLGFVDEVHRLGNGVVMMDYGRSTREREYGLAAWFLISSGIDLMSSNQLGWTAPGFFWPGYALDLGIAFGPRYEWRGLLRRDFQCGVVLLNQPDRPTVTVELPTPGTGLNGKSVQEVSLGSAEASIISHACTHR